MATIERYLAKQQDHLGRSEIMLRVNCLRSNRFRIHTGIFIEPDKFKNGKVVMPRITTPESVELKLKEQMVGDIETLMFQHMATTTPTKDELDLIVQAYHKKKKSKAPVRVKHTSQFYEAWRKFTTHKPLSAHRLSQYNNLARMIHRYESYMKLQNRSFKLVLANFDVESFVDFYKAEPEIYDKYPQIYNDYPVDLRPNRKDHKPMPRGDNAVCDIVKKLAAFFNWCVKEGTIQTSPMVKYSGVKNERYGTPIYLTKEERDALWHCDMSTRPQLDKQRDIFVFQCFVGCRVGDLYSLDKTNVSGDVLQYVPGKTKKDRPDTVSVPLSSVAKEIWGKYDGNLPFISQQKYNKAIKDICRLAGLDRIVTVINPTTGQDERKPIWQVASSHMARRTFVGNLYKRLKDPNIVSSMSGHKEGSRAFARYRAIDDDIRREAISLLE